MRRTVNLGVNPADIKPAYDNAPNTPAAPVPDDHVDTTFLTSEQKQLWLHLNDICNMY